MIAGFREDSQLICEGIVGDGCGGGRLFLVEDSTLKTYDPTTKEYMVLQEGIKSAKKITKDGCILTITCEDSVITFDLSTFPY